MKNLKTLVAAAIVLSSGAASAVSLTVQTYVSPAPEVYSSVLFATDLGLGNFASFDGSPVIVPTLYNVNNSFLAYCIEPTQALSLASFTTGDSSYVASAGASSAVQKLFDYGYGASLGSAAASAAFQLALWEVVADDSSLTSGIQQIDLSDPIASAAQTLLGAYTGPTATHYDLTVYTSRDSQDLISATLAPAIPEPSTYALLAGGLGLVGFMARRRKA